MGLNSPLWRSCDVTATPKSKTKNIKLTARTRPLICAIASRGTIYTKRNIGQNVQKWPIFNFVPKWHVIFNFFLEQHYHQSMRLDKYFRFIWVCWGGTASVKKVICKKPRILGSRNFWHILAQRRGDNPIPTRDLYYLVDGKFSGTFGFS